MKRNGFTLIEIMIALVILTVVLLGLARFAGAFLHTVGTSTVKTIATEVAYSQLALIRTDPTYPLPNGYSGTVTGFPGYGSMTRTTVLNRLGGPSYATRDYTVVTVRVLEPTMKDTVNVTAVVARP